MLLFMTDYREKAIQCSNKRCKEVFHIYECHESGGYNDSGFIAVKCKQCGRVTKIRMINPPKIGFYDNFEIVDAWEDGESSKYDNAPEGATALVFGNEPTEGLPIEFTPNKSFPMWQDGNHNLEITAYNHLRNSEKLVIKEMDGLYNLWVKGKCGYSSVSRCIVDQEYLDQGKINKVTWAKILKNDSSFNSIDYFHLLDHSGNNKRIDGVYSRDEMMAYLFRCLMRWKLIANQVVVVTPFIGFDFPYSKEKDRSELIALWELLNSTLDIEKTTFITRVRTYGSLKKYQKELDVPADVLKEWNLMNNLQKMVDNPQTRVKTKAQFHAKFYVGVFDDHVEMLSGSFNVQTGEVLEQMHLRNITRERFKESYLDKLVEGFEYKESYKPRTLYITVDKDGHVENNID